ncbi:hypothetical protein DEIPH_ctg013orf0033 [Deinococcus phoenicis]|uniref:Uncharacterized protein n=1 Tax=Deinococcus phoenicis TaxID=1476583 RepID=A0A016QSP0_9DEIO|nr:hypothetical protein [Deinococcus phoenicis]EYB68927.1 hypothetical protein DEIPH_ctg013orf0033 [Deinococcus phoenicis]
MTVTEKDVRSIEDSGQQVMYPDFGFESEQATTRIEETFALRGTSHEIDHDLRARLAALPGAFVIK